MNYKFERGLVGHWKNNEVYVIEKKDYEHSADRVQVIGTIVSTEIRNFRSRQGKDFTLLVATITNNKDSIIIKRFI